jgi:hypothetical protein
MRGAIRIVKENEGHIDPIKNHRQSRTKLSVGFGNGAIDRQEAMVEGFEGSWGADESSRMMGKRTIRLLDAES